MAGGHTAAERLIQGLNQGLLALKSVLSTVCSTVSPNSPGQPGVGDDLYLLQPKHPHSEGSFLWPPCSCRRPGQVLGQQTLCRPHTPTPKSYTSNATLPWGTVRVFDSVLLLDVLSKLANARLSPAVSPEDFVTFSLSASPLLISP